MTIQQIKYILGVAECGSLNKASEKLYISQPSLTSAVHELE
ncbi:MAG: LysR family transcriptional regulator, partial [Treponema sp.]|nr:LysR family transcriptional regulator [Treponema sp.]